MVANAPNTEDLEEKEHITKFLVEILGKMKQVASSFLSAKYISSQEAVYHLLGIPMASETLKLSSFSCSRSGVLETKINVGEPRQCVPRHCLTGMHADLMNLRN